MAPTARWSPRRGGCLFPVRCSTSGRNSFQVASFWITVVSTPVGLTVFTRIECGARSTARLPTRPITACLLVVYRAEYGVPFSPAAELVMMIDPPVCLPDQVRNRRFGRMPHSGEVDVDEILDEILPVGHGHLVRQRAEDPDGPFATTMSTRPSRATPSSRACFSAP